MAQLSGYSVLIVDPSWLWGYELRAHLVRKGAKVHVVHTCASARAFARAKKIDAALVGFSFDEQTTALRSTLAELQVPVIFTSAPTPDYDDTPLAQAAAMYSRKLGAARARSRSFATAQG